MATRCCAISINCDSLAFRKYFSLHGKGLFPTNFDQIFTIHYQSEKSIGKQMSKQFSTFIISTAYTHITLYTHYHINTHTHITTYTHYKLPGLGKLPYLQVNLLHMFNKA